MSVRRLRTLISVSERGTFVGAAEANFITQAAVSMQMKSLEDELGVALFDRSKRPPELNAAGLALIPKAKEIVRDYDALKATGADELGLSEEFTIGAVPTTLAGLVPKAVSALMADFPGLHVRVVPGLSYDLLPQIERGHLDVAIMSEPAIRQIGRLSWKAFAEEPLILLAPLKSPSADPEQLLESSPFIRFNRKALVGRLIDDWLQERRLRVHEIMELDTLESIATMVHHNLGVSIVPKRCVPTPNPLPLKRLPLGPSAQPRILGLLARRDSPKTRLIELLYEELLGLVERAGEVKTLGPIRSSA